MPRQPYAPLSALIPGGEPITIERHGLRFAVRLRPDHDTEVTSDDTPGPFVGVTVALLSLDGAAVTNEYDNALWGIEYDDDDGVYIATVVNELVDGLAERYPTTETIEHKIRRPARATPQPLVYRDLMASGDALQDALQQVVDDAQAVPVLGTVGWDIIDTTPGDDTQAPAAYRTITHDRTDADENGSRLWWIQLAPTHDPDDERQDVLVLTVGDAMASFLQVLGARRAAMDTVKSTLVDYTLPRDIDTLCNDVVRARRIAAISDAELVAAAFRIHDADDVTVTTMDPTVERGEDGAWVEAVVYVSYDRVIPEDKG